MKKKLLKSTKPSNPRLNPPLRHTHAAAELIHATLEEFFSREPQMWHPSEVWQMMADIQDGMDEMENPNK